MLLKRLDFLRDDSTKGLLWCEKGDRHSLNADAFGAINIYEHDLYHLGWTYAGFPQRLQKSNVAHKNVSEYKKKKNVAKFGH